MMVTRRPWLQLGRSALLLLSTALNFFALRYLQLDEALSILFSTPFIVAVLCGPFLGEWVGWRRWVAIGVGFFGVLLVARPGLGGLTRRHFCLSEAPFVIRSIRSRRGTLARTDSSETTLFYSNLVGAVAMLPIVPFVWTTPQSCPGHCADGGDRRFRQLRALSLDPRPPAGAGIGAGAVHLYPTGVDDDAWVSGVRRCAAPLDHRGWADRGGRPASTCSTANARWARR